MTFAPRLTRETCKINWQKSAVHVVNVIRGLCPSPAAYTYLDGQLLKIYAAAAEPGPTDQPPGTIGNAVTDGLPVAVSDGHVILKDIQLAGKKRMLMVEFLRGYRLAPGSILGTLTSKLRKIKNDSLFFYLCFLIKQIGLPVDSPDASYNFQYTGFKAFNAWDIPFFYKNTGMEKSGTASR